MGIKVTAADMAFSMAIRAAAGFACEHCGAQGRIPLKAPAAFQPRAGVKLECAHLYGRRNAALRWDMENAASLCHTCHRLFTEQPKVFTDWVDSEYPDRWEILSEKMQRLDISNNKPTRDEVAAHYQTELKRLTDAEDAAWIVSWI